MYFIPLLTSFHIYTLTQQIFIEYLLSAKHQGDLGQEVRVGCRDKAFVGQRERVGYRHQHGRQVPGMIKLLALG
jgi:hypothetical protein